jgi:hypothetical protein
MRPIGGEIEFKLPEDSIYYTDSGRSSLRVFIRNHKNLKYLIPNFFVKKYLIFLSKKIAILNFMK